MKLVFDCLLKTRQRSKWASSHRESPNSWISTLCSGDCTNSDVCRDHLRPDERWIFWGCSYSGWEPPLRVLGTKLRFSTRAVRTTPVPLLFRRGCISSLFIWSLGFMALEIPVVLVAGGGGGGSCPWQPLSLLSAAFFGRAYLTLYRLEEVTWKRRKFFLSGPRGKTHHRGFCSLIPA